jgi:hypothetical protein
MPTKPKRKKRYLVYEINLINDILIGVIIIGFILAIVLNLVFIPQDNIKGMLNWRSIIILCISCYIGFTLSKILINPIHKKIKSSNVNGIGENYFQLTEDLIHDMEHQDKNLNEISYFLKVITARTGQMLNFSPDNDSVNMLHQVEGMISITEAVPSEWLNPTYNFFLINNYIASLKQSIIKNKPIKAIAFSPNREDADFKSFEDSKKNILKEISELEDSKSILDFLKEKNIFVRFYILEQEELDNNKSIIETLIAGHDLFGCYLYFINKNVTSNLIGQQYKERFNTFRTSINYNLNDNKNRNDLAIALANTNLKTIYRKGNDLVSRTLTVDNSSELKSYLKELCKLLHNNYDQETHLFNSYFNKQNYIMNDEYCYIKIEK